MKNLIVLVIITVLFGCKSEPTTDKVVESPAQPAIQEENPVVEPTPEPTPTPTPPVADATIPADTSRYLYQLNDTSLEVYKNDGYGTYTKIDEEIIDTGSSIQKAQDFIFVNYRPSSVDDVALKAYKIEADGTLTFVKSVGVFADSIDAVISPDATRVYSANNTGTVWQMTFNTTTYATAFGINRDFGAQVTSLTATDNAVWGFTTDGKTHRSNKDVSTNDSFGYAVPEAKLTTILVGNTERTYMFSNNQFVGQHHQLDNLAVDDVIVGSGVDAVDTITSILSDNIYVYVTTDNHDLKLIENSDLIKSIPICTDGKLESANNRLVIVNCGTHIEIYHHTTIVDFIATITKVEEVDTGINPIQTLINHK